MTVLLEVARNADGCCNQGAEAAEQGVQGFGMYVCVMPSGAISFRLDYRLNGRHETVYLGKYGRDGVSGGAAPQIRHYSKPAREAAPEGSEELRAIRREVARQRPNGREHAGHEALDLRAGATSSMAQSLPYGDYAGRPARALR
jgi:hypothetical protein